MNTFHQGEPGLPSFWNNFHGPFPIREKISFIVDTNVLQLYRTDIPSVYIPPVGAKHALSCVVLDGCLFYLGDVSLPQFKVYIVCTGSLICTWYVPQFKILSWSCMFCCAMDFSQKCFCASLQHLKAWMKHDCFYSTSIWSFFFLSTSIKLP